MFKSWGNYTKRMYITETLFITFTYLNEMRQRTTVEIQKLWGGVVTHIWNNHGKFWVECVVHFANGSFVTPEGVVVLTVLGIWVADRGEHLVPRCGIGVRLWHAVWWLPANKNTGAFVNWCSGIVHTILQQKNVQMLLLFICSVYFLMFICVKQPYYEKLLIWVTTDYPSWQEGKQMRHTDATAADRGKKHKSRHIKRFWSILNNNYSNK